MGGGTPERTEQPTKLLDEMTSAWAPPAHGSVDGFPEWLDQGRYRRETRLGRGGMGLVYSYRDPRLDRLVAVKAMPLEWTTLRQARQRFLREARLLAALDHPNIARIHHLVDDGGRDYLILEFIPGRTLSRFLTGTPMPADRALRIALQVGRAIESGHAIDVIHRDIKPTNIMVTPRDVAKLLDYGIARHVVPEAEVTAAPDASVDALGEGGPILGTAGYMSPEQATGRAVDQRTDTWAFGCVLYEMLTGRPAFPGGTREERVEATLGVDPDWDLLPAELPAGARSAVTGCLIRDPSRRTSDIGEACEALERALADLPGRGRARAVPHNMGRDLTRYIPRSGELDRLHGLLAEHRLLTLTGPGGCGKTRLSMAVARSTLEGGAETPPPAGVWIAKLGSLAADNLVAHAVASTVCRGRGTEMTAGTPPLDTLVADLGDAGALLVLDNCEHLVAGCAAFVIELLMRCPGVRVLATSRESLGVPGEQSYPVPALSFPDADDASGLDRYESARLFLDRARLTQPDFKLGPGNAASIARICRRLEGIPLAIELAAARVKVVSVDDVAARLMDLVAGQPVLEASIASSVDTLDTAERTLLGRLTAFSGGWTLEAAEQVCGDDGPVVRGRPVIDGLGHLVSRSLVLYETRADRARYHLLETVREYCRRHVLRGKETDDLARRHLDFFLALSDEADAACDGQEQAAWLDRLEVEHDNLRGALTWAADKGVKPELVGRLARNLHTFWAIRGHLDEGRSWLESAVAARPDATDVLQTQLLNATGILAERQNDLASARRFYEQALETARGRGDERRMAGILTNLGLLVEEEGDLPVSRRFHEESIALYESLGEEAGVAMAQLNLGVVAKSEGAIDEAEALFQRCLPLFRERGDRERIAALLRNLGEIAMIRGEQVQALPLLRESLAISREFGDRKYVGHTLILLAVLSVSRRRWDEAAHLLAAAESLLDAVHAPIPLSFRQRYDEARRAVSEGLGQEAERRARTEGSTMTCDEATDYAMQCDV